MAEPTVADFKTRFQRDFPFADLNTPQVAAYDGSKVNDIDIRNAMQDAYSSVNPALFSDDASYTSAYLYLVAHQLVMNLRASSQGLAGTIPWLPQSKSAGPVSVSYAIPQEILQSPYYTALTLSPYGLRYLSLISSLLSGNVGCAPGWTVP